MADTTRDLLERIHQLQDRLADLHSALRRGPNFLKAQEDKIRKAADKLEHVKTGYRQLQAEVHQKEQEVKAHDQSIEKRKQQLAEAKTNKDYQALQLQIEAALKVREVLDDEALEVIDKAEQFEQTIPPVEEELKKTQDVYETMKKKFFAEKPVLEANVAEFTKLLQTEEAKLPREFRDIYHRLVQSNGGAETLAVVQNIKYCGGCNLQVPINSLAQIIGSKPVTCSSCGKLLYVPAGYEFEKG